MVVTRYRDLGTVIRKATLQDVLGQLSGERRFKLIRCLDKILTTEEIECIRNKVIVRGIDDVMQISGNIDEAGETERA